MKAKRWLRNHSGSLSLSFLVLLSFLSLIAQCFKGSSPLRSNFVDLVPDDGSPCKENEKLLLSKTLPNKPAFPPEDEECSKFKVHYLKPGCIRPRALASYPGSGNTWLRYLLDTSLGIFTGSRYKDLDIQSSGMWGEIRPWSDGSTIVQKTHDASYDHVMKDFSGGRGVLLLRNPYEAILSNRNFLYGGHLGSTGSSFESPEWRAFISSQMAKWLNTAMNWTVYSNPKNLMVIHLEEFKENPKGSLEDLLKRVFHVNPEPERIRCVLKYRNGYFHRSMRRRSNVPWTEIPFLKEERKHIDDIIDYLNDILIRKGFHPLPLHAYRYYRSSDEEIREQMNELDKESYEDSLSFIANQSEPPENTKGLEMVLNSYLRKIDKNGQLFNVNQGPLVSEYTLRIFSKALKLWPAIQESLRSQDPISQENQKDSSGIMKLEDISLPSV